MPGTPAWSFPDDIREMDRSASAAVEAMQGKAFALNDTLALGQLLEARRITLAASESLRQIAASLGNR